MAFINSYEWDTMAYLPISHDKPSEYISEVDPLEIGQKLPNSYELTKYINK